MILHRSCKPQACSDRIFIVMEPDRLLASARSGDDRALDDLLQWAQTYSYRVAYYVLLLHDEALEISQECAWRLFKNLERLDPARSIGGWVRKVSYNLAMDFLRRNKKISEMVVNGSLADRQIYDEKIEALERCIARLTAVQRTVISLFYMENMPIKEISELLEMAEGTVKTHLFRGREKLRKCLKESEML